MHRITAFIVAAAVLNYSFGAPPASAQTSRPGAAAAGQSSAATIESTAIEPATIESTAIKSSNPPAPAQIDAKRALSARMPETTLTNVRLEDAIAFLQDVSGANIHVNWRALEMVNITRQTPLTLRMSPMPLRKLLKYVLTEADAQNLATFYADDGVIEVTTRALADGRLITRVYPVDDLLLTIPNFTDAPTFQLQGAQTSGGGGGGSGQSFLGGGTTAEDNEPTNKNHRGQRLVRLVMDTVQPDVWRENGGTASIRFFRGRLIVTAPRSVHEQIGGAID
jgi:hypothetical protein